MKIPAFTAYEPWASLMAAGIKTCETRNHMAPRSYWGKRIAIHAGKKVVPWEQFPPLAFDALQVHPRREHMGLVQPGHVVATATLEYCSKVSYWIEGPVEGIHDVIGMYPDSVGREWPSRHRVDLFGDFSVGRWLWVLSDIRPLDPVVPAVGHQGFWYWEVPDDLRG